MMGQHAILVALLFVAALMISLAVALTILVRLPADYLRAPRAQSAQDARHGMFFRVGAASKNVLGGILIVIGAILSLPGVPGQGLLTVFAGLLLLDFPGKHRLLCKILSWPRLLQSINRLRTKFSRPPLVIG